MTAAAAAQGEGYPSQGRTRLPAAERKEIAKLGNELAMLQSDIMEVARRQRGWEGLSFKEIVERRAEKPDSIPVEFRRELEDWFSKADQIRSYMGGGGGQPRGREQWTPPG